MSVADNIRALRNQLGLTQEQLADKLEVARSTVTQWETGWTQPRMNKIQQLAEFFGVSITDIISESSVSVKQVFSSGVATVPLRTLGKVHAGNASDEDECDRMVDVPATVLERHPNAYALEVEGDCMDKIVPPGAHVLVDPDIEPRNGFVVVVETEDRRALMRRWFRFKSMLVLEACSHAQHDDIVLREEDGPIRSLGTVVWFQSAKDMTEG